MKHKLLSILLCLAMALSLLPTAALAEGETGTTGPTIKTSEELVAAIENAPNGDTITLGEGDFTLNGTEIANNKTLTFKGQGADKTRWIIGGSDSKADYSFKGATITFEDMHLKTAVENANYLGFAHISNSAVKNCTITGRTAYWGYQTATFENVTFNAPQDDYALWDYSSKSMTFDGCTFNISGKGVNVYVEASNADSDARKVEVKDCIVNSTKANKAFLNIKNSTQAYEVVITGNNTVYGLNADTETESNLYQVEDTTITETSGKPVKIQERAANGTLTTVYEVKAPAVAKVGGEEFTTLTDAFAALNETNHTLTLIDSNAWDTSTPVYWKTNDEWTAVATLTEALKGAYMENENEITIVCRPDTNVGTMTHGHVADNLTIYGNNAYLSGGECDLEVDTYMYSRKTGAQANDGAYLDKNITITAYEMDNLGVWGQRNTKHTVTVNLIDCDGREISDQSNNQQRVYISGTSGANNITLTDCDFITAATAVYSNADGSITIDGCSFTDGQAPVNFNHKANGTQTVTVKNSTFTNCGDDGAWKQFAAPIRFVNSGSGTMSANVNACIITETVGNNGDILIGDGRTDETSNNVTLTVSGTAADVQAQKPGYYNGVSTDDSKKAERELTADESLNTTIADLLPVTEVDLDEFIKLVTSAGYNFDGASVAGTGEKLTVKWSPVSGCFDTRSDHACTNAAATGNTPNRVNSDLAQYQLFKEATDVTIKNVNFEYIPANFTICANSDWAGSWTDDVVKSAQLQLETKATGDIVIDGCSFDQVVFTSFNNNDGSTTIKNSEFKNIYNSYAIKDLVGENGIEVSGCTFENCGGGIMIGHDSTNNDPVSQVTIQDNTFKNIDVAGDWTAEGKAGTRGIIQIAKGGDYTDASITLDGNTATNCGPILRQLNQGIADKDVLKDNLTGDLTGLGGKLTYTSDSVKKTGGSEPAQPTVYTVKFENADVAEMKVIEGTKITLPTPGNRPNYKFEGWYVGNTKVSTPFEVTGDVTLVAQWRYIDQGGGSSEPSGDYIVSVDRVSGGKVTVNPGRADKGDEVTVTVKPNDGYELDELVVTDSKGNEVKLTAKSSTKFTFTMPAGTVDIKATFVKIDAGSVLDDFTDVNPNAWYAEAVEFVVEEGLMTGTSSTTFAPDTSMSRAMIWTVLAAYNDYNTSGGNPWYAPGQQWAMVNGVSDGTSPNGSITREQLAVMLWRAAGSPETTKTLSSYADASSVSDWALTAMAWAVDNGIISGMGGSSLAPQTTATRAQVAVMLMQFVDYMEG